VERTDDRALPSPAMARELTIALPPPLAERCGVESLAALVDEPEGRAGAVAIVFLHGAGTGHHTPFMDAVARAWCERGARVLRLRQPAQERAAREGQKRPPDRMPVVLATTRVALDVARARWPDARLVLAGKSMGGRAATLLAAGEADVLGDGARPDVAALVALGYPLHPPTRPDELRVAHFPRIATPLVVAQGTRDPFGGPDELAPHLARVPAPWSLVAVDGGDHDFEVPRRGGRSQLDACADAARDTLAFVVQHLER